MYSLYWIRNNCKIEQTHWTRGQFCGRVLLFFLFFSSRTLQGPLMSVVATTTFLHYSLPVDISSTFATSIFFFIRPDHRRLDRIESGIRLLVFPFLSDPRIALYTSDASRFATFFFIGGPIKRLKFPSAYCPYGIFITVCVSPPSPLHGPVLVALPYVSPGIRE